MSRPLGTALVGAGYWGARLARNLHASDAGALRWVCDVDTGRATRIGVRFGARATSSIAEVLDDADVDVVVVATPAGAHAVIAATCLSAGRHVLVEKPLATSLDDARALAESASARGLVLMCDHTYRFAAPTRAVRDAVASGAIGDVRSIESIRTNQGHGQPDVDVLWDLAHHDVSILAYLLPSAQPVEVAATVSGGARAVGPHRGDLVLELTGSVSASIRVDWFARAKARTMVLAGSEGTIVWDDLDPSGPRVAREDGPVNQLLLPHHREPLALVVDELFAAVSEGRQPSCGATDELAVLTVLAAATQSAAAAGTPVPLPARPADALELQG